jgi:glutathione S-transferase
VICEYLESAAGGGRLFPAAGPARWAALRRQALADGILDAAVLRLLEGRRPAEQQSSMWFERWKTAMARALDVLEKEAAHFGDAFDIGHIAAAAALGYIDFRFAGDEWRNGRPALAAWFDKAGRRPSVAATTPREPA